MNTFANGLTCSTFVGKTVHFSVAIYNLLDRISGTVSTMTVRQVAIVVIERSQRTRKAFLPDFKKDFTKILPMPIFSFHICVVKVIRQSLLASPFRKSVPAHILPYGLSGNIQSLGYLGNVKPFSLQLFDFIEHDLSRVNL